MTTPMTPVSRRKTLFAGVLVLLAVGAAGDNDGGAGDRERPSKKAVPAVPPQSSLALTKELLDLDLGYSIAKEEILRKSSGAHLEKIDRSADYFDDDVEYGESFYEDDDNEHAVFRESVVYDNDDDGSEFAFHDEESSEEYYSPHLVRESVDGGPNPVGFWLDPSFWTGGGGGGWGPFGGRPQRRPPKHRPRPPRHRPFPSSFGHHRPPPSSQGKRFPPRKKTFVGDQHQCSTGSCEFFLFCWLGGGVVKGGCGGFLFACCQRPQALGHDVVLARVSPKK